MGSRAGGKHTVQYAHIKMNYRDEAGNPRTFTTILKGLKLETKKTIKPIERVNLAAKLVDR
jgi:hypothetical protein